MYFINLNIKTSKARKRPATVIGEFAVDLRVLADAGAFQGEYLGKHASHIFSQVILVLAEPDRKRGM